MTMTVLQHQLSGRVVQHLVSSRVRVYREDDGALLSRGADGLSARRDRQSIYVLYDQGAQVRGAGGLIGNGWLG